MCQPPSMGGLPSLNAEEVKALALPEDELLLLDVRQPEEYIGPLGHLPGASLIPLGELSFRLGEIDGYKDKTVVCICKSGVRSAQATQFLLNEGFQKVFNMTGGTQAWNQLGFPVER